ncbi:MAG: hypothetical protein AAFR11_00260 [Pseudomonadota bacterium]
MKRLHRRAHLLMWLILGPAAFATVVVAATSLQPSATTVEALPQILEGSR